jgi:hypothetical protein
MRFRACPHDAEVKDVLHRGHWPHSCAPEIRAHVEGCKACRDLVLVTQAFRSERAAASAMARIESPGVLWWRAQLRRRNAALEKIARPMLGAQVFAAAVMLIAATLFLATQVKQSFGQNSSWFSWLLSWVGELPRTFHMEVLLPVSMQNSGIAAWLVLAAIGGAVLLSGVLVYRFSDER